MKELMSHCAACVNDKNREKSHSLTIPRFYCLLKTFFAFSRKTVDKWSEIRVFSLSMFK